MEQDLNPDVVEHLRVAERGRAVFEAAGLTVRGWEPYCLAFMEPELLRRELARQGPPDPEIARRLQALRDEIDPLLGKLRGLIPAEAAAAREADLQDMLLGFVAGSPAARAAAVKWTADPKRYAEEAVKRLSAIENYVDRCRAALRTPAPAQPVAQPGRARIALLWPAVPGAVRYQVQRAETAGGPYLTVATPDGPGYTDAGLTGGTTYYYVIRAFHPSGPSGPSPETSSAPLTRLSAPEGLRAEASSGSVRLSWSAVAGAQHYRVMRSTAAGGPYSAIAQPAETSFVDPNLQNGTAYYYTVRAVNASGKGEHSAEAAATPIPVPAAPQNLRVSPATARVLLRWAPSEGAVTYTVKRATSPGGPYVPIAGATGVTLSDPTISYGTSYYYVVSAANSAGESADSAAAEVLPLAPPAPPARPRASAASGRVVLEWDPVPGAVAYVVLRGSPDQTPSPLTVVAGPPLLDDTVRDGEVYLYALLARNSGGDSGPSDAVQAAPRAAPPPAPEGLAARAGDGRVDLTWTPSAGAASYVVHRSPAPGEVFLPVGTAGATSYADTTVANGETYVYAVTAVNPGGTSPFSIAATATPLAPPAVPAGLNAVPASGQISLTWPPAPGALSYEIRRADSSAGPFTTLAKTPAPAFIDGTAPPGRPAFYTVSAVNEGGQSAPSETVSAVPLPPVPEAPASLVVSASSGVVKLAWPACADAFDYIVRRGLSPEGPFTPVGTVPGTAFADATVRDGTTYHYQVTALNAGGESAPSDVVAATPIAPPAAPAAPRVVAGDDATRVEWAAVDRAEAYVVRRAESGQEAKIVARLRETSWADAMTAPGLSYVYTVSALNAAGESEPSPAGAPTPQAPPATPTGITGSSTDSEVTVRWTATAGADRYRIKRATTREGPYQTVAEVREPSWTDRSVENGKTYFYTVRAFNGAGKSGYSARLRATPNAKPGSPAGLAAAAGDGEVSLAWRPVDKAVGYKVKRAAAADGPWTTAGTTRHTSWTDRDLVNGESYWYAVTSVIAGIESEASGSIAARPAKDAQPPTLESLAPPAQSPESLPPGVDMEKLEDLRRGEQLRGVFAETGQKFEPWELLTLLAEDGAAARKSIETVLRLRDEARTEGFTTGAIALFERILKVRAAHGGFVRRLREYMGSLDLDGAGPAAGTAALEIALGFLVSAPKGRQRAELWLREAESRRREAAEFLFHASSLARNYIAAMQDQNDG
ncbi:MAG TPA: fibronectin type III domain-containing protein [Planctomycetota bacterium]